MHKYNDIKLISKDAIKPQEFSSFTGLKLDCPPNFRAKTLNPYSYNPIEPWEPQPQFWYDVRMAHKGPTWPVGDPSDYRFTTLQPSPKERPILETLELERPERYSPGEIYKNKIPKDPVANLKGSGGCTPIWVPRKKETFNFKLESSMLPTQPCFDESLKEIELKTRERLVPPDKMEHKSLEKFEKLVDNFKFMRRSENSGNVNKNELPYRAYIPVNVIDRLTMSSCDQCLPKCCKNIKHVVRNKKECSCCNSKEV